MPSTVLRETLATLRETYAQQAKSATTLLTALETTFKSSTKAQKAFNDYTAYTPVLNSETALSKAQSTAQRLADIQLKETVIDPLVPELKREIKTLSTFVASLRNLEVALRGEYPDVVKLGKTYESLKKIKITDAALPDVFREIEGELEEGQRALGTMFGAALRDALAEKGLELGGRPPTMTIGRFEISVDFIKRKATLSYGKEVVAKGLPLSVDGLIKAYEREQKAIINRPEDGTTWIRHLYEAWNTVRGRREGADLRANIVECYFEMVLLRQAKTFRAVPSKHSFVDYTRAQFAYDLDRYLAHQPLAYKGFQAVIHVAIKANTDNAERSVWVVSGNAPHDGRYVGDLVFQKEGK